VNPVQDPHELGEELFFAADDAGEVEKVALDGGVVDGGEDSPAPGRGWCGAIRTNGRLTLRDAPGARNVKLAWITIARVPEDP